jgi:hypothetical protein
MLCSLIQTRVRPGPAATPSGLCLLSAVCCLLSAVCCLLSAVCCLLSAVCCLLSAVCCLLFDVCSLLSLSLSACPRGGNLNSY